MRVLAVASSAPWPLRSGAAVRTFHLLRAASRSCEVHFRGVLQPGSVGDAARAALSAFCASVELFPHRATGPWSALTRARIEQRSRSTELERRLRADVESKRFDLVHVDEAALVRALPPDLGVPLVVHHHKLDLELAQAFALTARTRFDASKVRALDALAARRTRFHVVCGAPDRERLLARHPDLDVAIVPNGVDAELAAKPAPFGERDDGRVLFLGALDSPPNVDALAWYARSVHPIVREARANTILEIVGSGARRSLNVIASTSVRIQGEVDDVRHAYARAALCVAPQRIGGGTRVRILEALALGCPVVATRIGAEGLDLEDGVHLRIADGAETFAGAVIDTLTDRDAARARSDRARAHVLERCRWETSAAGLVGAWNAAISELVRQRALTGGESS